MPNPRFPRRFEEPSHETPQQAEQPGSFSSLRRVLGMGTRVGAGVISGIAAAAPGVGSLIGAGVSGAGEGLAQLVEGSPFNKSRIGVEAALGAVPFGKWIGAGRGARGIAAAGRDFLAGGAASGLGEAGREWAMDEEFSPGAIAASTAVGGALGAGIGTGARWLKDTAEAGTPPSKVIDPIRDRQVRMKGGDVVTVREATPPTEGAKRFGDRAGYEKFKSAQGYGTQQDLFGGPGQTVQVGKKLAPKITGVTSKDLKRSDPEAVYNFGQDVKSNMNDALKQPFKVGQGRFDALEETLGMQAKENKRITDAVQSNRADYEQTVMDFDEAIAAKNARLHEIDAAKAERQALEDAKLAAEESKKEALRAELQAKGFEPEESFTEVVAGTTPDSKLSKTIRFKRPSEEADLDADFNAPITQNPDGSVSTLMPKNVTPAGTLPAKQGDPYGAIRKLLTKGRKKERVYETELPPADSPEYAQVLQWLQTGRISLKQAIKNVSKGKALPKPKQPVIDTQAVPDAEPSAMDLELDKLMEFDIPTRSASPGVKTAGKGIGKEIFPVEQDDVDDPIAALMNAVVDNPRDPSFSAAAAARTRDQYLGPFDTRTGITAGDVQGVPTSKNWVEAAEEGTDWPPEENMWRAAVDALKKSGKSGAAKGSKNPKGRGNEAGFFAGAEIAAPMAGGLGGAAYGATQDEGPYETPISNRVRNAALYGLLGAGAGYGGVKAIDAYQNGELKEGMNRMLEYLPNLQRFNLLMSMPKFDADPWDITPGIDMGSFRMTDPGGLLANAVVGPYGSALAGGLESMLAARIGGTGDETGYQIMRQMSPANFGREMKKAVPEAMQLLREGEMGRAQYDQMGRTPLNDVLQFPGLAMTTGDRAAGNIAENAGMTPGQARAMTLTNEPEGKFMHQLSNLGKGSTVGQLINPFRRTPVNVLEQGLRRTPGLGIALQMRRENPDAWNEIVAQQLLGAGYGIGGYELGNNVDPDTAKWLRRYVTNAGGRYSMLAGAGFAAGQANQSARNPEDNFLARVLPQMLRDGNLPNTIQSMIPLPSADPVIDAGRMILGGVDDVPGNVRPPRGVAPDFLYDTLFPRQERRTRFPRRF